MSDKNESEPGSQGGVTEKDSSVTFIAAFGKVVELRHLDDFVWATVRGWGALPMMAALSSALQSPVVGSQAANADAEGLAARLKEEERALQLYKFTGEEASKDYPYLFSLVAVRLWAMAEAAAREVLVEALKIPLDLPVSSALTKLRGPVAPYVGASVEAQANLIADALWHSVEGDLKGVDRFDAPLDRIGLKGSVPTVVREILQELSEVRHCVVHRGGLADRRLLAACPWLAGEPGDPLPTTLSRFWLYRTATYWYVMDLARRWSRWRKIQPVVEVVDHMEAVVLEELIPAWQQQKKFPESTP